VSHSSVFRRDTLTSSIFHFIWLKHNIIRWDLHVVFAQRAGSPFMVSNGAYLFRVVISFVTFRYIIYHFWLIFREFSFTVILVNFLPFKAITEIVKTRIIDKLRDQLFTNFVGRLMSQDWSWILISFKMGKVAIFHCLIQFQIFNSVLKQLVILL